MPRTLEEIHRESPDSPALRGLVGVLNDKLQLRARYALLEYEAGAENRADWSQLVRLMSRLESEHIARLGAAISLELQSNNEMEVAR
jgi:hypothetical protein